MKESIFSLLGKPLPRGPALYHPMPQWGLRVDGDSVSAKEIHIDWNSGIIELVAMEEVRINRTVRDRFTTTDFRDREWLGFFGLSDNVPMVPGDVATLSLFARDRQFQDIEHRYIDLLVRCLDVVIPQPAYTYPIYYTFVSVVQ